jgi:hypothetical protein
MARLMLPLLSVRPPTTVTWLRNWLARSRVPARVTPASVPPVLVPVMVVPVNTLALASVPLARLKTLPSWRFPVTVSRLPPERVKASFTVRFWIVSEPKACVTLMPGTSITASSLAPGPTPLLQLAPVLQSPEPPIHETVASIVRLSSHSMCRRCGFDLAPRVGRRGERWRRATVDSPRRGIDASNIAVVSYSKPNCGRLKMSSPQARKRSAREDAWPVRILLGGEDSPAALGTERLALT